MTVLRWVWRQLCRLGRLFDRHRIIVAFSFVTAAMFFSVTVAYVAIGQANDANERTHELAVDNRELGLKLEALVKQLATSDNKTRCRIVSLVGTLLDNTERSARATLASPVATDEQKAVARKNLNSVAKALALTRDQLGHPTGKSCAPTSA